MRPYAELLFDSSVMSATYANMMERVTAKEPDSEIIAKKLHGLTIISGIGAHVKNTESSRKVLRPQTSESAPRMGALRNDRKPLIPCIRPLKRKVCPANVSFKTSIIGVVRRPQAKN